MLCLRLELGSSHDNLLRAKTGDVRIHTDTIKLNKVAPAINEV